MVATFCGKSWRSGGGPEDTLGGVAATAGYLLAEALDFPSLKQELVVWENSGVVNGEIEEVSVCFGGPSMDVGCVHDVAVLHVTSKMVETTEEEGSLAMVGDSRDWHSMSCTPVEEGSVGKVPPVFGGLQVGTEDG